MDHLRAVIGDFLSRARAVTTYINPLRLKRLSQTPLPFLVMEPLSVLAILTFIKDVTEQVRILKDTIDKVSDNDEKSQNLIARTLKSLDVLGEYCGRLEENPKTLKSRRDLDSYIRELERAITKCKELVPHDRSGIRTAIGLWWIRDKIASELEGIERDLAHFNQTFITVGAIRIERAISDESSEVNNRLDLVDKKLQTLINGMEKKPEDAIRVLRVDDMNRQHIQTALHRASMALDRNVPSPVKKQCLRVIIGTLKDALEKPRPKTRNISHVLKVPKSPSSNTHYPNTGIPSKDIADAFLDALDILQVLRTQAREMPSSELAHKLNTLSTTLYDIGLFDDSCAISRQAVGIYRKIAFDHPGDFESKLAVALNNLSIHIDGSTHNAPAEALAILSEAIQIYRNLVGSGQRHFNSDLATLLINSATRLGQLKRYAEAANAAKEALSIFAILAHGHQATFTPDLAVSLCSVSTSLRDMEQYEDARLMAKKAVEIFRTLEANGSHQLQPAFATALLAYSRSLTDCRKYQDALKVAEEAVNIRRTLADHRPEVYTRPLLVSLRDLFDIHRRTGHYIDACRTAKNASEIYRHLIQDGSVDLESNFASLLMATASCFLDRLNFDNDALTTIKEAIGLYSHLPSADNKLLLAESFDIAHTCYTRLGDHHKAYQVSQEAIRSRRGLNLGQSDSNDALLGTSVTNSANSLRKLERFSDAAKQFTHATLIYRRLVYRNQEYRPDLAFSLHNLSCCLSQMKDDDKALEAAKEAVKIYRKLANDSPDTVHSECLAASLYNLAHCYSAKGEYTAALQPVEDAVREYKRLHTNSSSFLRLLEQSQKYCNDLKEHLDRKSSKRRV